MSSRRGRERTAREGVTMPVPRRSSRQTPAPPQDLHATLPATAPGDNTDETPRVTSRQSVIDSESLSPTRSQITATSNQSKGSRSSSPRQISTLADLAKPICYTPYTLYGAAEALPPGLRDLVSRVELYALGQEVVPAEMRAAIEGRDEAGEFYPCMFDTSG